MSTTLNGDGTIVLESSEPGRVVVPQPSRLKRLNYFDGKFLRADDLRLEQDYLRRLVHVSNQAGGPGVVAGLDTTLHGDLLRIGTGQAIDGEGRVLLLSQPAELSLTELIESSRGVTTGTTLAAGGAGEFGLCEVESAAPSVTVADGGTLYVIWLGHAEALCGEEDVVGQLCEAACTTSIDRPYRLEGVVVRALPLSLTLPPPPGNVIPFHSGHLRSRAASAYYADEWTRGGSLISAAGLALQTWCLGSHPEAALDVPVALVGLAGSGPLFLDQWIVRRERQEPPSRRYWAGRMAMRPWPAYLAQILQFQCQLADVLGGGGAPGTPNPCGDALEEAKRFIASIEADVRGEERAAEHKQILDRLDKAIGAGAGGTAAAALVNGGIVETPSAGYLPVELSTTRTVNEQVQAWFGDGVDLRFCVVRPDFVAHALEEARHMERISLLKGLADATQKPKVDVLVPNGTPAGRELELLGRGWDTTVGAGAAGAKLPYGSTELRGVTRTEVLATGGGALHFAGAVGVDLPELGGRDEGAAVTDVSNDTGEATEVGTRSRLSVGNVPAQLAPRRAEAQVWFTASCLEDLFSQDSGSVPLRAELAVAASVGPLSVAAAGTVFGEARIRSTAIGKNGARRVRVTFTGVAQAELGGGIELDPLTIPPVDLVLTLRQEQGGGRVDIQYVPPEELEERLDEAIAVRVEWSGTPAVATISTLALRNVRGQTQRIQAFAAKRSFKTAEGAEAAVEGAAAEEGVAADLEQALEERITFVVAREDAAVLDPDDVRHRRAEDAVERIGCLLDDETFTAEALATLFPPPSVVGLRKILPTLDWVLFHRRRDKDCGEVAAPAPPRPPVPPATVCHSVFRLESGQIESVQALIQEGRLEEARRLLTPLGTVTFDEETSNVVDAGTVAARWGAAAPAVRAWPYWVDGDPEAGSTAVREARVRAIGALVGAGDGLELFGGEVDGPLEPCPVWTLLEAEAEAPPATVRHEVHYLRQDSDFDLIERLRKEPAIVEAIAAGEVPQLGHAVFESGGETIVEADSNLPPLPFTWLPDAYEVLVFRGPVDVSTEPLASQAKVIAGRLVDGRFNESFNVSVLDAATQDGWPADASVISVVSVTG